MTNSELIQKIINDVSGARDGGAESIGSENLIKYLKGMETGTTYQHDIQMELLKAGNQSSLEVMKLNHASELEAFRSVIAVGANAAKSFMIINGGAAIALLAFLGNIWNKNSTPEATAAIAGSLLIFCMGVLCSGVCSGFTYLSQYCTANSGLGEKKPWKNAAIITNCIAILAGFGSLALFAYGAFATYASMGSQFG